MDRQSVDERHAKVSQPPTDDMDLLFLCMRPPARPGCAGESEHAARIAAAARKVSDWPAVAEIARHHRVRALLYAHLKACCADVPPPETMRRLETESVAIAARNAYMCAETVRLHAMLASAGLRALAFKGAALASMAYGDAAVREYDDIDFLVAPSEVQRAAETLLRAGYLPVIEMSAWERRAHLRAGWGYALRSPDGEYFVDLESSAAAAHFPLGMTHQALVAAARSVEVDGHRVETLPPDLHLLCVCVHAGRHVWTRLAWIADVCALAGCESVEWDSLRRVARDAGAKRMLAVGLHLAAATAGIRLPERSASLLGDGVAERLAHRVAARFRAQPVTGWSPGRMVLFRLAARERVRDRIAYLASAVFKPSFSDWRWLPLPPAMSPLYWVLRPVRLAWGLLSGAWRAGA